MSCKKLIMVEGSFESCSYIDFKNSRNGNGFEKNKVDN